MKVCGVAVAMLQGQSWAPTPSNGSTVNVGTIPAVLSPASSLLVGGKARRRLMLLAGERSEESEAGKAGHMAKGSSVFRSIEAVPGDLGEYRGSVARPR